MKESTLIGILYNLDDEKLASAINSLSEEEAAELEQMLIQKAKEPTKEASAEGQEADEELEKIAADYFYAGRCFGLGMIDALLNKDEKD